MATVREVAREEIQTITTGDGSIIHIEENRSHEGFQSIYYSVVLKCDFVYLHDWMLGVGRERFLLGSSVPYTPNTSNHRFHLGA